jgi:hypothetical protein
LHETGSYDRPSFESLGVMHNLYYLDDEIVEDLPVPVPAIGSLSTIWDSGDTVWDDGDTTWF